MSNESEKTDLIHRIPVWVRICAVLAYFLLFSLAESHTPNATPESAAVDSPAVEGGQRVAAHHVPWVRLIVPDLMVAEWFELDGPSDYMSISGGVNRSEIPGTAHVDGSARPQTVQEGVHPGLHAILRAFERITGVPVLVNAAFRAPGEPIVCSPIDAYRCMMRTGLDCIVMEDVLVWRHEQNAYDEGHGTVVV